MVGSGVMMFTGGIEAELGKSALVGLPVAPGGADGSAATVAGAGLAANGALATGALATGMLGAAGIFHEGA